MHFQEIAFRQNQLDDLRFQVDLRITRGQFLRVCSHTNRIVQLQSEVDHLQYLHSELTFLDSVLTR